MKRILFAGVVAATASAAAAVAPDAGDEATRNVWRTQKVDHVDTVQRVYNRVVKLSLPRPFISAYSAQRPGFYIMEFIPDGQTTDNWDKMITVTGTLGVGAAHLDDTELAAHFEPKGCPGKVFRDLGPTAPMSGVTGRMVVIGCGAADQIGAERGAIAVYRDTENSWTVQYAERNHGKPPFAPEDAVARLNALAPLIIAREPDASPVAR
jgi:hypothetical protein